MSPPAYTVILRRSAARELGRLPSFIGDRIVKRLVLLEVNPRPSGIKKLQGQEGYRLRVGDYRILFTIDDRQHEVIVYAVGHRRDIYR